MERGMERGDDVEVVEGLRGGGEERVEEGRGVGRESADEAEVDGDREGEGEERGGEGRDVGEWEVRGKGFFERGREREEGVVGGLRV
jgi:hypothetical protein